MENEKVVALRRTAAGYLILPKPGIVALVVVSGITGLYIGGHGNPEAGKTFWTVLGLALATGGAAALNNYVDRDIDSIMPRTRGRSIPSGTVPARAAYVWGAFLVALSLFMLNFTVGAHISALTGAAVFIYVVLYSVYLKRQTPLATHIGGVSGAMPPLIGYAAAHGSLDIRAGALFLIIVVWQQPHFWSLALKYREDYALAKVPTLPVVKGVAITKRRILLYVLLHFPVMFLPFYLQMAGQYYLFFSLMLSIAYLFLAVRFMLAPSGGEMTVFHFSNLYLMAVFGAMILDAVR